MNTKLPSVLETKLADFRRRVWVVKLAEGLLAALFGIAISYLLVFALDRFFETPGWLRLTLLVAGAAVLGLGLPLKWHRWVWRQRRLEDAARLLRHKFPRLGDQLLGIVELARMDQAMTGRSERLVAAAMAQAAEAVADKDFTDAVPEARHRHWGWAAAAAMAVIVVAFSLVNEAARNAVARWIMPWKKVERFTFARVENLPERLVVPYAEPFEFPVKLAGETRRSPSLGSAELTAQPGVSADLKDGGYAFKFPPQKTDTKLSLVIGDVREEIAVQPRTRPELVDFAVRLRLPDYLGYTTEPRQELRGSSVNILRGAQAAFEAKASRALASAELDGNGEKVEGDKVVTGFALVAADAARTFSWKDLDGLSPRDPLVLKVHAVEDDAPKILARRESLEQVVLDSEVVTFDLAVSDDFGVKRVGLEWTGSEDTTMRGEKIAAAGANEKKEMTVGATFCATREGVAPQTIEVRAWAEDYLPERKRAHSASFVLQILNKTDHALWLTQQFGRWLEVAKESYEREQALHQANKELRALDVADLDRPENRRRVSQQAAAENANAARLEALNSAGRRLVEQATKNDEFDAKRLESWATMLQSLKDIAAIRMPSVADLLKQSASAATGKLAGGKPGAGSPNGQNEKPKAGEPKEGAAKDSAPGVQQGDPMASVPKAGAAADPNAVPKPAAPSIQDNEKGYLAEAAPKPADPNAPPKPPGAGKLGLPSTTLAAAPHQKPDEPSPAQSPAQAKMDTAIDQQKDLLAEFAKVSDQLGEILASLEASTFVKRFKAASRQQMKIASSITEKTLNAFGIDRVAPPTAQPIALVAKDQSEVVRVIQSDLSAYFQRKQDAKFKNILEEMKKTEIVRALARGGEKVAANLSGQSLIGSEFWADTMDRWSEELVAASNCKSCSNCNGDSLPPEIVLKVMQALRDEMKLRDETRETENAKEAIEADKFTTDANVLGEKQGGISENTQGAMKDILAIPEGASKFGKELSLLNAVVSVMDEARDILSKPETGEMAIAAETEAIELLMQARRMKPNNGGGGGSNPGGGGRAATASSAALSDLGPGSDENTAVAARQVGQATGRAGREFPAEFKTGLDAYFGLLEGSGAGAK